MWLFIPVPTSDPASPSGYFPSAPALAPSSSDSTSSVPPCPPLLWRGKPMPQRTWSRLWRMAPWIRLLSGVTSEPSALYRGLGMWISWLQGSPVRPIRGPAQLKADRTAAISQVSSSESSVRSNLPWCSSKTWSSLSADPLDPVMGMIFQVDFIARQRAYIAWATEWKNREWSRLQVSEPPITDIGRLSWLGSVHPTERAFCVTSPPRSEGRSKRHDKMWPTPTVRDSRRSGRVGTSPGSNPGTTLCDAVYNWMTRSRRPSPPAPRAKSGERESIYPNPEFVESLHGLPIGWTACGSSVASLPLWRLRARLRIWFLVPQTP